MDPASRFAPSPLRRTGLACALAAALALPAFAQQDYSKVEIKTEKLSPTTYMMVGAGGNLGVAVGEDAVFLIDDQFAPLTPKIAAAIAKLSDKPVKFVLNTHWHGDHTGGNENLGRTGALIVAHDNVRKRLSTEQFMEFINTRTKPEPRGALPAVTFANEITFHLNGDELYAFHAPRAHTDGDAVVWFRNSNVIHMGDTFFNQLYPFIDASSGGSLDGTIAAADRALSMINDATKVIPGHGPLGSRADLLAYRTMLATIGDRIKSQIKNGAKLEEVIASKPTAEFDETWGKGFLPPAKFVEMLYRSLPK
jgi:glyoxylase-like metal-dependent hydrolase (beta-lactamase superfamily II)